MRHDGIYRGKANSKRCVFRCFLKVATEIAVWTDSRRLFQRDGHKNEKLLHLCWSLPKRPTNYYRFFDLSEREGSDVASME